LNLIEVFGFTYFANKTLHAKVIIHGRRRLENHGNSNSGHYILDQSRFCLPLVWKELLFVERRLVFRIPVRNCLTVWQFRSLSLTSISRSKFQILYRTGEGASRLALLIELRKSTHDSRWSWWIKDTYPLYDVNIHIVILGILVSGYKIRILCRNFDR
jgi:hypothetical protein